jgi:hypothetical protein
VSYDLYIGRADNKISRAEWEAAVATVPGLRLAEIQSDHTSVVELKLPLTETWVDAIGFQVETGMASFSSYGLMDDDGTIWQAIGKLCSKLGATLTGDEGETYDLTQPFFDQVM